MDQLATSPVPRMINVFVNLEFKVDGNIRYGSAGVRKYQVDLGQLTATSEWFAEAVCKRTGKDYVGVIWHQADDFQIYMMWMMDRVLRSRRTIREHNERHNILPPTAEKLRSLLAAPVGPARLVVDQDPEQAKSPAISDEQERFAALMDLWILALHFKDNVFRGVVTGVLRDDLEDLSIDPRHFIAAISPELVDEIWNSNQTKAKQNGVVGQYIARNIARYAEHKVMQNFLNSPKYQNAFKVALQHHLRLSLPIQAVPEFYPIVPCHFDTIREPVVVKDKRRKRIFPGHHAWQGMVHSNLASIYTTWNTSVTLTGIEWQTLAYWTVTRGEDPDVQK
ncbi:hypothetical protein BU24DRAFT_463852 [Aaosphaeria arxii CBS 175.79]|uniref:Uncharacterized protein n=1 Tax=Aaosphaeria arxii CBS 175.79 TaxID=1450172 RepID=A0A6A5XPE7_9PLEO|nr:uncharacterized protein BU24DRAFT_463852 [Aaosphaeria arxii CBS 175.79]KAF2015135.1 hypothetical protein BU24DRAFT_463852 [Aaosphaeria arxii CBS 175.79]